jgi:tRNA nucleotidyltransferase (CCA-adding enzyme)
MAVRRTSYPQVEPRARDLMTRAVAVVPATLPLAEAARVARRRRARLLLARLPGGWGGLAPEVLERALGLGLARIPVEAVLWEAPSADVATSEVLVRRKLGPARPFVVVTDHAQPAGAVFHDPESGRALLRSVAAELDRLAPATRDVLRTAGRLGGASGARVAAVGGLVRDLLLDRAAAAPRDLDVVIEGDGRLLARRLGQALGGQVHEHDTFLTATVTLPDGLRVDVATARRERYRAPGTLPAVEPASLADDLERRDFSVNALAARLDAAAWGEVLDPTGGLGDLTGKLIRVLHPLSFIEDPTRIFRAARFAERLGFRLGPTTRRLLTAAAALPIYEVLSGDRLMAELEAILREPAPAAVLDRLGRLGAFRLLVPGYRYSAARAHLSGAAKAVAELPLAGDTVRALYLAALGAHLGPAAGEAWAERWGASAPAREAMGRAWAEAPGVAATLGDASGPGAAHAVLGDRPELTAAWAWVVADRPRARRFVAEHLRRWRALPRLVTGEDLKALGLAPGPLFRQLLAGVRTAQVARRVRSRDEAAAWVRRRLASSAHDAANGSNPDSKGG